MPTGLLTDAPIPGLDFRTPTTAGRTDAAGRFSYTDGEDVEFALGPISIGTARGAAEITARDLVTSHAGLLQTLGAALAAGKLTPAEARNELRRALNGIVRETDVRVPVRDGSYLLADVFRPAAPGRYPVLLRLSVYGRAFGMGSIVTEDDRLAAEVREDEWFEPAPRRPARPGPAGRERGQRNTSDWVPRGYVCVRVDSRGVGRTPGTLAPFSPQEALDYYDAIEWAAQQDWSDGNVGLYGSSYTGTNQWNVANLAPPSLKAIMPWAADGDAYRELAYPGGILAEGYRRNWWTMVTSASPASTHSDFYTFLEQHPFDDPAAYGPAAQSAARTTSTSPCPRWSASARACTCTPGAASKRSRASAPRTSGWWYRLPTTSRSCTPNAWPSSSPSSTATSRAAPTTRAPRCASRCAPAVTGSSGSTRRPGPRPP